MSAEKRSRVTLTTTIGSSSVHHCPHIMRTGRYGCWASCRCGFVSPVMTTTIGASVAWAEHVRHAAASGPSPTAPGAVQADPTTSPEEG